MSLNLSQQGPSTIKIIFFYEWIPLSNDLPFLLNTNFTRFLRQPKFTRVLNCMICKENYGKIKGLTEKEEEKN